MVQHGSYEITHVTQSGLESNVSPGWPWRARTLSLLQPPKCWRGRLVLPGGLVASLFYTHHRVFRSLLPMCRSPLFLRCDKHGRKINILILTSLCIFFFKKLIKKYFPFYFLFTCMHVCLSEFVFFFFYTVCVQEPSGVRRGHQIP